MFGRAVPTASRRVALRFGPYGNAYRRKAEAIEGKRASLVMSAAHTQGCGATGPGRPLQARWQRAGDRSRVRQDPGGGNLMPVPPPGTMPSRQLAYLSSASSSSPPMRSRARRTSSEAGLPPPPGHPRARRPLLWPPRLLDEGGGRPARYAHCGWQRHELPLFAAGENSGGLVPGFCPRLDWSWGFRPCALVIPLR
jgi:hypothetical protein